MYAIVQCCVNKHSFSPQKAIVTTNIRCRKCEWEPLMRAMIVSLCYIGMCYWIDEMSEQTRQGFPVWETPRHCKSKGVINSRIITTSLTRTHTRPYPNRFTQTCHAHAHTHYQCILMQESQDNHSSHCSLNYLHNGKKGVAGQTVNQCQDAYDYASFTFSLLLHPFLCRVPSALSTLPTASLNTHLQTSPHSYQGDGNVTLNCCHFLLLEYHWAGHKEEWSMYASDGSISWIFWVLIVIQNNNMGHSHQGILRSRE